MVNAQTMKIRSNIHQENINKRGKVDKSLTKKNEGFQVGPVVLGVFLFVVVGSVLFELLNVAKTSGEI